MIDYFEKEACITNLCIDLILICFYISKNTGLVVQIFLGSHD